MCGILGFVTDRADFSDQPIHRSIDALAHRGPDAHEVRTIRGSGAACILGHTRLRIIDLSPLADQPMPNEDGTVWVAYNGEIYNFRELRRELENTGHRLRSHTDTDVLVHLYEESNGDAAMMLGRLRGMFAFALFDTARGRLLLARDRLGIKPMYWAQPTGGVAFASEVRALARAGFVSGEADSESIASYLTWGVVRGPSTILSGVSELPPGSFLEWTRGSTRIERWWRPQLPRERHAAGDAEMLVRGALTDAVSRHLVADRPLGAFLSGGVDSSAVVKLAARHGTVRALTVTFPDSPDEGDAARNLAEQVGAAHDTVPVTGQEVASALPDILAAMDQPTSDGVNAWIVCRATRQAGLVVALSGLGGDELFGGYPSARLVPRVARVTSLLAPIPAGLRARAAGLASARAPGSRLSRVLGSTTGYAGAYQAVRSLLQAPGSLALSPADFDLNGQLSRQVHPQDRVMLLEMAHYLPNQLLRDTDQMSMAHSLEIRVPLLDDLVVRSALAIPADVRTAPGKALLARAAGLSRVNAKRPFALPFEQWMRGPMREVVREAILSDQIAFADVISADFRRRLWQAFEARRTHWSRPWAVAVLRLWPEANGFSWR
ncbi:MAG TPA: asparagine synthase (glutamine-hydrolyzing) [Candidatus Dormibacteraeota bacterium]|nr:asparagine synthase (glutamine-hydrolyzing) [Candidatus Dormibacteraeota bacterium]